MPKAIRKTTPGAIYLKDPKRFSRLKQNFEKRGYVDFSMAAMIRVALDEWMRQEEDKVRLAK